MQREIRVPFAKCKNLIEDGDVLLFRCPKFPKIGWFIALFTFSTHSHVGLAFIENNEVYSVEFKEFHGSRIYPLSKYFENGSVIDIYRPPQIMKVPYLDAPPVINGHKLEIKFETLFFNDIRKRILDEAKSIVNQKISYGWSNIWKIILTLIPFIRLIVKKNTIEQRPKSWVCSTLVAFCYRRHFLDLCPQVNDSVTTPADISGNALTQYIMTITEL